MRAGKRKVYMEGNRREGQAGEVHFIGKGIGIVMWANSKYQLQGMWGHSRHHPAGKGLSFACKTKETELGAILGPIWPY